MSFRLGCSPPFRQFCDQKTTDGSEAGAAESAVAGVVETAAASGNRSHPRLRKREGPAAEGSGRGPAQPDVSGGWLPRNEVALPSVVFWSQNWRKGGLQPRRNEIVREQCFYNQNWCGCEFSKRQTL
ncbi:MAG: epoxyqueuosine reductase QueH [Bacteroidales bacterium]|nr:epoxyqueuosine reductase QueH [Bacteroidales bacterium]